jgi:glucose/arabinose dehydrogenase
MQQFIRITIFTILVSIALLLVQTANSQPDLPSIKLPVGFRITVFADDKTKQGKLLAGARFMAFDARGNLYVSSAQGDKVLMLPDSNKDGIADEVILVSDNLNQPQGLAFVGEMLLVANEDGVVKLEKNAGSWSVKAKPFIKNLPYGHHTLKSIKLGPDGYLYLNIGSSCNVCIETDPLRATIMRYTVEGKPAGALATLGRHQQSAIWARGLRNSQGFAWHPLTGAMYATNNGADLRSDIKGGAVNDDIPPEHLIKLRQVSIMAGRIAGEILTS